MPGPAARMGDPTAHGGAIAMGFPMVLIGGMPAARLADMHVCPMATPAPVPVPHVGGPVSGPGVPTVLIGGMPAATLGDMLVCVGPPDVIAMGCPTVIIGMGAGSGGGSGGAGGGGGAGGSGGGAGGGTLKAVADNLGFAKGAAAAAVAGASSALNSGKAEHTKLEGHWLEFQFVDSAGLPVSGVPYELTLPGGKKTRGTLNGKGRIRRGGVKTGQAKVALQSLSSAKWSAASATVGEQMTLTAKAEGFESGAPATFRVYQRDLNGADTVLETITASVQGTEVRAEWTFAYPPEPEGATQGHPSTRYSHPQFYFEVSADGCQARSGMLEFKDYIEIELVDDEERSIANAPYVLYLSNGTVRRGTLDGNGRKREENIPPVRHKILFPDHQSVIPVE